MSQPRRNRIVASHWLTSKLAATLNSLPRHKRAIIFFEPIWSIPFGLFAAYASLYQQSLGLSPVQIGLCASANLAVYTVAAFIGGQVVDRVGRTKALLVADVVSWSGATAVWAISHNFTLFMVAAMLNGVGGIAEIAFGCLLVEDTRPEERLVVFSWLQVIDLLSGLLVPFAGVLVGMFGVVAATRGMYWFAFVCMTTQFFIRNALLPESSVGLQRIAETRGRPWLESLRRIPQAVRFIVDDRRVLALFVVSIITRARYSVMGVYLALFLTGWVGASPARVAIFPTIQSVMLLLVTVAVIPALGYANATRKLTWALAASSVGVAIMAASPKNHPTGLWWSIAGMIILGGSMAIVNPYQSTVWHNSLRDDERASVQSIAAVMRTFIVSPAAYIAGVLYSKSPVYVLAAVASILALGALVLLISGAAAVDEETPDSA